VRQRTVLAFLVPVLLVAAACGDDDTTSSTAAPASTAPPAATEPAGTEPGGADLVVVDGAPFPAARCEANRAAGTITFLTGFDYAAASSIVEVINADALGYYEELCLDVEIQPSFSTANYALVAGGQAQFASGGSFSEVVAFAGANDADLVAVTVAGRSPIDTLILKPGVATELADLAGTTIGVKGKLPSSVEIMLARAGLVEGEDFETVLLDGFDPVAHLAIESIVGVPGWRSNEPGRLEREGVPFETFTPADLDVPGSFGAIFTSGAFLEAHPTAAEDFVRATLRGLLDAIADPDAAAERAVTLVEANGNPNFLSPEGEIFRWSTEAGIVSEGAADGTVPGTPDPAVLAEEVAAYAEVGLFGDGPAPSIDGHLSDVATRVTADGTVVWPAG
jgi:NitT/TauT family transport system substrate-binding protein